MVGTCTRSCARVRVSRQSRALRSRRGRAARCEAAACRGRAAHGEAAAACRGSAACCGEAALRPPCGRAQLVSILIVVGTCTRSCARVRVSRLSRRAEPRFAARGEAAAACRGEAAAAFRCRVSACRGEAALRLIDPRKLYSILRPGSINRLIVNNPRKNLVREKWPKTVHC